MRGNFDAALIASLRRLVFFERASAHVLAGCLPQLRDFRLKRLAARELHVSMTQALRLRECLVAFAHRSADLLAASKAWIDLMLGIDAYTSAEEKLLVLATVIRPLIIEDYLRLIAQGDEIIHATLLDPVRAHLALARREMRTNIRAITQLLPFSVRRDIAKDAAACRESTCGTALDDAIWAPTHRAPAALRPPGVNRGENGALPLSPLDAFRDREGIALFLHNNINEEYTTLELVARNSYEHPDMPWTFHLAMARQAADEARHAEMQERLLKPYGVRYGDYPVYVTTYDMLYAFEPCPAGGKRELLWRLLLRSTYQEALSLDSMCVEIERRDYLGQPDIARVFHYLLADEMFHVESGLRWSRTIADRAGLQVLVERDLARDHYLARENHERLRFIVNHPEKARAEGRRLRAVRSARDLPFTVGLHDGLRRRAGFSDADLEQVRGWNIY